MGKKEVGHFLGVWRGERLALDFTEKGATKRRK